ncbi:unnamed protein product [Paramecium pentaurelia]|uniref:Uncharacterized protein n=1 Tax=Paramecium pentaurelia TaxID=43138 RepID=A0A8S1WW10_9CILI|nr:unnamed protein product [Paramecium pentaurelia]
MKQKSNNIQIQSQDRYFAYHKNQQYQIILCFKEKSSIIKDNYFFLQNYFQQEKEITFTEENGSYIYRGNLEVPESNRWEDLKLKIKITSQNNKVIVINLYQWDFNFYFNQSSIEKLINQSDNLVANENLKTLLGVDSTFQGTNSELNMQDILSAISHQKTQIDNLSDQVEEQFKINQKQLTGLATYIEQQNQKVMDILQVQSQAGNLLNLPSLINSDLCVQEKKIAEYIQQLLDVDKSIQNVFTQFNPKIKLTLIMHEHILNILSQNREFIQRINPLILQKLYLISRIISNFQIMAKSIKGQSGNNLSNENQQKLKSICKQMLKYKNLQKQFQNYFEQINFQFKNDELENQIKNLKYNEIQYQTNKKKLQQQISLLKKQVEQEQQKAEQFEKQLKKYQSQNNNNEELKKKNQQEKQNSILREKLNQAQKEISSLQIEILQNYQIQIHQGDQQENFLNKHTILDQDENCSILKFKLDAFKGGLLILALYINKLFKGNSYFGLVDKRNSQGYFNFMGKEIDQQFSNDLPVFFLDQKAFKITSNIIPTKTIFKNFQEEYCVLIFDTSLNSLSIYKKDGEVLSYKVILPYKEIEYIPCIIMNQNDKDDNRKDQLASLKFNFINVKV